MQIQTKINILFFMALFILNMRITSVKDSTISVFVTQVKLLKETHEILKKQYKFNKIILDRLDT